MGRIDIDIFIQEYYVRSLVNQYKFIDTYRICTKIISEFEDRTIYIRAMKTKLVMVDIFYHIAKNDEVFEITSNVLRFARRFNIPELLEECITYHVRIDLRNRDFDKAEEHLLEMPDQNSDNTLLLRFKKAYVQDDKDDMKKYFDILSKSESLKKRPKDWKFLQVQAMSRLPEIFDRDKYLELLNWLIEFASENNVQEMITLAYNHLIMLYHQERSYKKALEIADKFLHFKKIRIDNQV